MIACRTVLALAAGIGLLAGCGPQSSNRSPTPEQDPDRYARAARQSVDVQRENQAAEAAFYRQLGRAEIPIPDANP